MNSKTLLGEAIAAVENTLAHHQAIWTNGQALSARADEARLVFMNRVQVTSGDGSPLHISRGHPEIENILNSDSVARYLVARAVADTVLSSPQYVEADSIIAPLVAAVRRLEIEVAAENEAAQIVAAERRTAIAEATAKALAEVEARFSTAPPEPAPLIRGKITSRPELATV